MTLGTHAVVGGAVAAIFPSHPIIAFVAGFASHFILDAIPHWDYKLLSKYSNPDSIKTGMDFYFLLDLLRVGSDAFIGFILLFIFWNTDLITLWQVVLLGAIGGMLPDFLQFVYMRFPHQPMIAVQKFHNFMHAEYRLDKRPLIGVTTQIIVMIAVTVFAKYLIGL